MSTPTNQLALYYEQFQQVSERLNACDWFTGGWEILVYYFGQGEQQNPGFRLQKTGWFNDPGPGIHFESWLGNADLKRSAIPISMHFEASYKAVGIRRGEFYDYILEQGKSTFDKLKGYTISPKSYQLFINRIPFTADSLVEIMETEYGKLQALGSVIDEAIHVLRKP